MAFLKKRDSANILDPKTANGDIADLKKSFKSSGQKRKRAEKPGDQRKSLHLSKKAVEQVSHPLSHQEDDHHGEAIGEVAGGLNDDEKERKTPRKKSKKPTLVVRRIRTRTGS